MKNIWLFLLAFPVLAIGQTEKGVNPINQSTNQPTGQTRAVVIGISDYQEKDIPDLRFADKDAEAFANFLRSPAGGSLDNDHLQILTNQNATAGRVAEALDALVEQTKEGDHVIIYFSGHGDVERKTISQPGFLLCWDSPARVYMGGGTYSLAFLQEIVSTLSTQNKAKVLVVTDACHAGKLAGSQIGGAQATAANLAKQFANEVKILSCQPNEFSLEGEQWGGGRGVFSYHLVDGLFGLADKNGDAAVSLFEIGRYLEDRVTAEAAPQSQIPMVLGNKTERLATVNAGILADLQKFKSGAMKVFLPTEQRGLEDEVLAKLDSGIVKKYFAFKKAVAEKRFFQPENDCAEAFYAALSTEPGLAPLQGFLKRNYAAALQDDAQQVMNKWLKTNLGEWSLSKKTRADKYQPFPRYLERAAQLLGPQHYMYPTLKARAHFFEGYLLAMSNQNPDKELGEKALAAFRHALQWQAEQPQVFWQMSNVFGYNLRQPDSAELYAKRVIELDPSWILPYSYIAFLLSNKYKQFERARPYLEQISLIDSTSAIGWHTWGVYYFSQKKYDRAERHYKKAIQLDSAFVWPYLNLGAVYHSTRQYENAERCYLKAIQLDSTQPKPYLNLGGVYAINGRYPEAEQMMKKAIQLDSTYCDSYISLGAVYLRANRFAEAESQFKKAIQLDPTNGDAHYRLANAKTLQGQLDSAFEALEQAFQNGYNNYDWLQKAEDLTPLRALPNWDELMKKYFPNEVKD